MNLRGLMTSLGAGGSLIAAALCAAALVGGIIAVRGAAGGAAEANTGDVTMPRATAPPVRTPAPGVTGSERRGPGRARRAGVTRAAPRAVGAPAAPPPRAGAFAAGGQRRPPARSETTGEDAGGGSGAGVPAPPPATGEQAGVVRRTVQADARGRRARSSTAVPEPVARRRRRGRRHGRGRGRHGRRDARAGHRPAAVSPTARAGAGSRAARGCGARNSAASAP